MFGFSLNNGLALSQGCLCQGGGRALCIFCILRCFSACIFHIFFGGDSSAFAPGLRYFPDGTCPPAPISSVPTLHDPAGVPADLRCALAPPCPLRPYARRHCIPPPVPGPIPPPRSSLWGPVHCLLMYHMRVASHGCLVRIGMSAVGISPITTPAIATHSLRSTS